MSKTPEQIASELGKLVRGEVFGDLIHTAAFSTDASIYRILPLCVVAPQDARDVCVAVEYAAAEGIPVVGRGAGSGLAGESLCSGIVFDMARHMNRILSVDDQALRVVCEPGVVLGQLNEYLAEFGRKIGPDPSSANRATVGGCVANNSTGAHWLEFGYIGDYVESIEAVLSDGTLVEFHNDLAPEHIQDPRVRFIASESLLLISHNEQLITKSLPRTKRNRCGYNIWSVCRDGRIDLARMLAGSEGTLALFTKITLRTVPLPPAKGLLQLEFDSLEKMAEAVPAIVNSGASACELIDEKLIAMAIEALPEYRDILPAGAAAVLLVEHTGSSDEKVSEKIRETDSVVGDLASGRTVVLDPAQQARLWQSRKDAGPLLFRQRSRKHPAEFMEDVSVDNERLGEYLAGLRKIGNKYGIEMAFFGHAGDSELHIRPMLDLADANDRRKMRAMAEEVFSLAWSLGGSISGEHADGLVRAAFVRKQYGAEFYEILCRIKQIFDPAGLMNPGKIINDDPDIMLKNLRAEHTVRPERIESDLLFDQQRLALELEQCYGCGVCLSREPDLRMCPVFRALGDELASSRAKANLLNFWATGQLPQKEFESARFREFLDLCINCKACAQQCPSGVDVSTLMTVARAQYARRKGLRRAEKLLSRNRHLSVAGSFFAPLSNFVMKRSVTGWLLEKCAGIDRRRAFPSFNRRSFLEVGREYLAAQQPLEEPLEKVAYFVDTYANYNDHELGFAVLDVLRANGIDVILPKQRPAPLPAIVYGDVKQARKDLQYSVRYLIGAVRQGRKILCSEPSAALCLKDELPHYVAGADAELVSQNTYELMSYLLALHDRGRLKPPPKAVTGRYAYHLPCHLWALGGQRASMRLLRELCGLEVVDLAGGCCGLAGTFGMQKKNYELSSSISERLWASLRSSDAGSVLTECAACAMQIRHISDKRLYHPIKVLAQAYAQ